MVPSMVHFYKPSLSYGLIMCQGRYATVGGSRVGSFVVEETRSTEVWYCMTTRSGRSFKGSTDMVEDGRENAGVSEFVKLLLEDRQMREVTARREAELMEARKHWEEELSEDRVWREVEHQWQVEQMQEQLTMMREWMERSHE